MGTREEKNLFGDGWQERTSGAGMAATTVVEAEEEEATAAGPYTDDDAFVCSFRNKK